jgi:threonylcarbamoyladenosine tRNA methylthiotransferase MtaB
MPQVARDLVKARAQRLRQAGEAALQRHLAAQVGARRQVLVETRDLGRTEHFTQVRLPAPVEPGVIVELAMAAHDGRHLIAA